MMAAGLAMAYESGGKRGGMLFFAGRLLLLCCFLEKNQKTCPCLFQDFLWWLDTNLCAWRRPAVARTQTSQQIRVQLKFALRATWSAEATPEHIVTPLSACQARREQLLQSEETVQDLCSRSAAILAEAAGAAEHVQA